MPGMTRFHSHITMPTTMAAIASRSRIIPIMCIVIFISFLFLMGCFETILTHIDVSAALIF